MQDAVQPEPTFRFGTFELDPENEELRRNGIKLKLTGQPLQVLVILLEHPGRIVTREELQKRLWANTFVDFDHNLNTAINKIREVLGDSAENPRFVETLPRRGYRFICPVTGPLPNGAAGAGFPVEILTGEVSEIEPKESSSAKPKRRTRVSLWGIAGLGAAVIAALIVAVLYLRRPLPPPHISEYVRLTLDGRHKWPVGAGGDRLYLNIGDMIGVGTSNTSLSGGVLSLSGGEVTRIPFDFLYTGNCPGCATIIDGVSPDGSKLLVAGNFNVRWLGADLWIVDSAGRTAQFLTRDVFRGAAAWSPDGKQILYSNRHGDLFVIPAEGGESKLILPSPAAPGETLITSDLSWSPDGTRIRFARFYKYWEMSSSGANLHRLLPGWDDSTRVCCGSWSPDGDFFFFLAGVKLTWGQTLRGGQIWVLDERKGRFTPRISDPIQLTEGPNLWSAPIVSSDGKRIFSRQTLVRGELVRYDTASKQHQPFLNGISAEFVDFSRDGKYVAYVSFPDGILWRANRDGTGTIQLTRPPYYPKAVKWSPDGTQLKFNDVGPDGEYVAYVISSQGGTPRRLVPQDPRPQLDITWSPDGKQVTYCTEPRFSPNPASSTIKPETVIFDLASRKMVTLPPWKDGFVSPQWSPDGRLIVGVTSPSSRRRLVLFDLQSRQYRTLWEIPSGETGWIDWDTWSHDGRYIYFLSSALGSYALLRMPLSGGRPEMVVDLSEFQFTGWFNAWFGLDPQDAPLLLRDRGTQEIYALTLERK